ncbi:MULTISPECIES: DUF559 domain-containing protein [Pseudonocardia]|uniref:DUF559 domain-containing protein n=1 Tax=Pseudonocardia autotrophica TaxID=2074 RepID=A0A1Y2N7U6_PSEAH|nr:MULTISPECIES: DUF559 domain-containing protein [Pseudonocardia]OSY43271.1 hypothetical protein BG845_00876 [Pseudonocardia autotrophica]TDN71759.1 very-short-patch-repair endonuclease [Pseudonocardia autotrophica]BBG02446.1 hypothetical protein Pdca_36550 [Pseudonocardia autotrophica]
MRLAELLTEQAGVLSRAQALGCGVGARTVARRRETGAWIELFPGVYLVSGHRLSPEARLRAVALWAGHRCTVHGPAAAFWHGLLPGLPATVAVTVPRALRRRARPGVRLRHKDLADADRVVVRQLIVTSVALTVLETAAGLEQGAAFLDRALQRHVSPAQLQAAHHRALGGHGMGRAGRLLLGAMDRADSAAERRLTALLRRAGVSGMVRGMAFGRWTVDLAFPEAHVAIEVDGWAWHVDTERFRNDRRKQNALVAAGWTVLRFTWSDIHESPGRTVAAIRDAVHRGRRSPSGP